MTQETKIAVVILNWNGKKFLEQFLPSVIKYSATAKIVVADNCSSDDSISFLRAHFPQVTLLELPENYGFAKGYNEALKQIEATYYVLLNSDVEVTENWLTPCINTLDNDSYIGACQPKIKDFRNKSFFEYAGAAGGFIDKYGYPFCRGRIFDVIEEDKQQYDSNIELFWASGACLFIRSSLFHQLGGFDPLFFAHMEEIDLCWRLQKNNFKIMFVHQAVVFHVGGGTLSKVNPKKTFLNYRNNLLMLYKNLPKNKKIGILITRLFLDGLAGIKLLLEGKPSHTFAIIKAHISFYKLVSQYKTINPTNKKLAGLYPKSILIAYHIKKQKMFDRLHIR